MSQRVGATSGYPELLLAWSVEICGGIGSRNVIRGRRIDVLLSPGRTTFLEHSHSSYPPSLLAAGIERCVVMVFIWRGSSHARLMRCDVGVSEHRHAPPRQASRHGTPSCRDTTSCGCTDDRAPMYMSAIEQARVSDCHVASDESLTKCI